nr:MAG TPA: hypothetical protein [Caudoviricetes sp.]
MASSRAFLISSSLFSSFFNESGLNAHFAVNIR